MKRLILRLSDAAKKARSLPFAALAVCAMFSSCSDYHARTESVSLALPAWPPYDDAVFSQITLDRWEIRWRSGADSGAFDVPASARSVSLNLDANLPCAVLAQPVTNHGETSVANHETRLRFFMPAGAVFPATNKLTWEDGFTATVCMELCETSPDGAQNASLQLSQFNWGRFSEKVAEKAARAKPNKKTPQPKLPLYNPWYVDRGDLRAGIIAGEFKNSLLTVSKSNPQKIVAEVNESTIVKAIKREGSVGNLRELLNNDKEIGYLIPQYVPLYAAQNEREKILLKHGESVYFLSVKNNASLPQEIAYVTVKKAEESGENVKSGRIKSIKSVAKFLYR